MSVIYDLSQRLSNYGIYHIKSQSSATGYEDSDFAQVTYNIGATISIAGDKVSIVNVINGVTSFGVYIDGVLVGNALYSGASDWELDLSTFQGVADGKHTVELCAIGTGIADNRSNPVTYYRGTLPIYGVSGLTDSTPTLYRTDDAEGMDFVINSSSGSIDSDFNEVFPWNEAEVVEDDAGMFLSMPEMFFRVGTDGDGRITDIAVSKMPSGEGDWFSVEPFMYGCYGASLENNKLVSKSGVARRANTRRYQFRSYASNNGSEYYQLDLYHRTVMLFLWWIEWATKKSDSIMSGVISGSGTVGGSSAKNTGGTDEVETPSGFELTRHQMRYHYIEDFVGNYWEFVDGICCQNVGTGDYVTADPSKFSDDTTGKTQLSYTAPSGGYIKAYGWDSTQPFMCMPCEVGGSNSTYFCDYSEGRSASAPVLLCGASCSSSSARFGLSCCYCYSANNNSYIFGARLLKNPA